MDKTYTHPKKNFYKFNIMRHCQEKRYFLEKNVTEVLKITALFSKNKLLFF